MSVRLTSSWVKATQTRMIGWSEHCDYDIELRCQMSLDYRAQSMCTEGCILAERFPLKC